VYPTQWIRVHAATSAVEAGVLLEDWASDAVPEGTYVFRLTVRDTLGQEAVERSTVTIRNVHLTAPVHNDIVRSGDVVPVRGTVFGAGRTYTLAHGVGRRPSVWSTRGITLAGGGLAQVIDGQLGTWDTGDLIANEFYTLRLTARAGEAIVGTWTATLIYVDARLRPGWPQHLVAPPGYGTNDWRQITAADMEPLTSDLRRSQGRWRSTQEAASAKARAHVEWNVKVTIQSATRWSAAVITASPCRGERVRPRRPARAVRGARRARSRRRAAGG